MARIGLGVWGVDELNDEILGGDTHAFDRLLLITLRNPPTLEKEAIRRHLLATMVCSANTGRFIGSTGGWVSFWQGLFKKSRML